MEGEGVKMKRFDKACKVQAVKMVTEEGQRNDIWVGSLLARAKENCNFLGNFFSSLVV